MQFVFSVGCTNYKVSLKVNLAKSSWSCLKVWYISIWGYFKKAIQKIAEVTGDFIENKSGEKVAAVSRLKLESQEKSVKTSKERYISPEKK